MLRVSTIPHVVVKWTQRENLVSFCILCYKVTLVWGEKALYKAKPWWSIVLHDTYNILTVVQENTAELWWKLYCQSTRSSSACTPSHNDTPGVYSHSEKSLRQSWNFVNMNFTFQHAVTCECIQSMMWWNSPKICTTERQKASLLLSVIIYQVGSVLWRPMYLWVHIWKWLRLSGSGFKTINEKSGHAVISNSMEWLFSQIGLALLMLARFSETLCSHLMGVSLGPYMGLKDTLYAD